MTEEAILFRASKITFKKLHELREKLLKKDNMYDDIEEQGDDNGRERLGTMEQTCSDRNGESEDQHS